MNLMRNLEGLCNTPGSANSTFLDLNAECRTTIISRALKHSSRRLGFPSFPPLPVPPPMAPPPTKRRRKTQTDDNPTEGLAEKKESPVVVFAHGAGAPSTSEWMVRWKKMIGEALGAVEVVTFDYPYLSGGKRRAPPKAEKLVDHHLDVVKSAVTKYPGHPLILAGKSMGSRVSCMVAGAEGIHVSALICLGYPLKGMNGAVRDEILLQLSVPTMFVQGSKDNLCALDKLETTQKKMKCPNELYVIEGGDHSFKIGKKLLESTGINQAEAEKRAVEAISEFVTKTLAGK